MKTYRLHLRQIEYQVALVEAESREAALALFGADHDERGEPLVWEHSDFGDSELIGVDEEEQGEVIQFNVIQDGKFTD